MAQHPPQRLRKINSGLSHFETTQFLLYRGKGGFFRGQQLLIEAGVGGFCLCAEAPCQYKGKNQVQAKGGKKRSVPGEGDPHCRQQKVGICRGSNEKLQQVIPPVGKIQREKLAAVALHQMAADPQGGKSTGAAYIFSKLKLAGVNAELVTEFAKDKVWEDTKAVFENQAYIFGKQDGEVCADCGIYAVLEKDGSA